MIEGAYLAREFHLFEAAVTGRYRRPTNPAFTRRGKKKPRWSEPENSTPREQKLGKTISWGLFHLSLTHYS